MFKSSIVKNLIMYILVIILYSNTVYAATTTCSTKITGAKTITATATEDWYVIKWTSPIATRGNFINNGNYVANSSTVSNKCIIYTDINGNIEVANPYVASEIKVKRGTITKFCMAGDGTARNSRVRGLDNSENSIWYTSGNTYKFLQASCTFTKSYNLSLIVDDYVYQSGDGNHLEWVVRLN